MRRNRILGLWLGLAVQRQTQPKLLIPTTKRHNTIASTDDIARQMATLRGRLTALNRERSEIAERLGVLERAQAARREQPSHPTARVTMSSPTSAKIALFRNLFRGREDVLPRRWQKPENRKSRLCPHLPKRVGPGSLETAYLWFETVQGDRQRTA